MFQSPCGDYTLIRYPSPNYATSDPKEVSVPLRGLYPYKWMQVLGTHLIKIIEGFSPLAGIIPL